jgi:TetR/AcrR family transcriptional regulator
MRDYTTFFHPSYRDHMASTPPGQRRMQILQALAEMLEQPKGDKITTAALARKLEFSEAALYRHFASKAQMFEGLIEFIEATVFGLINQIAERQDDGLAQARDIVGMLLQFASNNPGMTRVLIGDALVNEDERLQQRMNQFYDRVELALKQALRVAAAEGQAPEAEVTARAGMLASFVLGRWHRYAKSGFKHNPAQDAALQIALLLA